MLTAHFLEEDVEVKVRMCSFAAIEAHLLPPGADGGKSRCSDTALTFSEFNSPIISQMPEIDVTTLGFAFIIDTFSDDVIGLIVLTSVVDAENHSEVTKVCYGAFRVGIAELASTDLDILTVRISVFLDEVSVEHNQLLDVRFPLGLGPSENLFRDMNMEAGRRIILGYRHRTQLTHRLTPEVNTRSVGSFQRDGFHLDGIRAVVKGAIALALEPVGSSVNDFPVIIRRSGIKLKLEADTIRLIVLQGRIEAHPMTVMIAMKTGIDVVLGVPILDEYAGRDNGIASLNNKQIVKVHVEGSAITLEHFLREDHTVVGENAVVTEALGKDECLEAVRLNAGTDGDVIEERTGVDLKGKFDMRGAGLSEMDDPCGVSREFPMRQGAHLVDESPVNRAGGGTGFSHDDTVSGKSAIRLVVKASLDIIDHNSKN